MLVRRSLWRRERLSASLAWVEFWGWSGAGRKSCLCNAILKAHLANIGTRIWLKTLDWVIQPRWAAESLEQMRSRLYKHVLLSLCAVGATTLMGVKLWAEHTLRPAIQTFAILKSVEHDINPEVSQLQFCTRISWIWWINVTCNKHLEKMSDRKSVV